MKLALVNDIHWGVRGDAKVFLDASASFFDNEFFPYIDKHKIDTIINLGDLVDRRKYINFNTADHINWHFIRPIMKRGLKCFNLAGNHDESYRDRTEINALDVLYWNIPGFVNIIHEPVEYDFDSLTVALVPWICPQNETRTAEFLRATQAPICMGHFEISGYEIFPGHLAQHGMNKDLLSKFDKVFSGHFHLRSHSSNIWYLGTPYQMTWTDYGQVKGFHVFDTETRELAFIPNERSMFMKVVYDDAEMKVEDVFEYDFSQFAGKYVKVIVQARSNSHLFDSFYKAIEAAGAVNVSVLDQTIVVYSEDELVNECEDTLTTLQKTVTQMVAEESNRHPLIDYLAGLYHQSLAMD